MGVLTYATVASELAGLANDTINAGMNVASTAYDERVQSIAEKARRSVMMYKVLMSAGIRDAQLAGYINKYLENMYSIFTLITLGYNPVANDNKGINSIVDSVSAESLKYENLFSNDPMRKAYSSEMLYLADHEKSSGPRIGKRFSAEASDFDKGYNQGYNQGQQDGYDQGYRDQLRDEKLNLDKEKFKYQKDKDVANDAYKQEKDERDRKDRLEQDAYRKYRDQLADSKDYYKANRIEELRFIDAVSKNNINAYPTIISMKITVNYKSYSIPIAVKCNVYPIGSEELRLLIESGISGKPSTMLRKIKWRSGEISTLDYIFNTDIAKRDKKLYEKLGRNPWYQELQKRKTASKAGFWTKIIASASGKYDKEENAKAQAVLTGYRGDIPPTASLVVTTDDLVSATRLNLDHFTKNDGFIEKFMKESFLLAFSIVDLASDQVKTFFMGYKNPFIISFDDLKKESGDPNKALYDSIRDLARKV